MIWLLACAIKATLIFTFAAITARLARSRSAALRHRIWAVAIFCTILLPAMQALLPQWHATRSATAIRLLRSAVPSITPAVDSLLRGITVNATLDAATGSRAAQWILAIWLAGMACVMLHLLAGLGRLVWMSSRATPFLDEPFLSTTLRLARQLGVNHPPNLLTAQDARVMPCTWGFRRPRILLPANCVSWPEERRVVVLAHELAHISRGDWPVRLMAECARGFYWFHPLAWIAVSKLAGQSELACDDAVLSSGVHPDCYAHELLDIVRTSATSNKAWSAALAVARTKNLERRFTAMLDSTLDRRRTTRTSTLFTTAAALLLLLPMAALRAPGQETQGAVTGAVFDANGAPLRNATIVLTNAATRSRYITVSDAAGTYRINALPAGDYEMASLKAGFVDYSVPQVAIEAGRDMEQNINLQAGASARTGKQLGLKASVASASLEHQVHPQYPSEAKAARLQGAVVLGAVINAEGEPESLRVMNPEIDPLLSRAAVEAVNQWRYRPVLLNGEPVSVETTITVNFTLSQ